MKKNDERDRAAAAKMPAKLMALQFYFVRASALREVIRRRRPRDFDGEPTTEQALIMAVDITDTMHLIAVLYGLIFVVIEGFADCGIEDPTLKKLCESENFSRLRRFRNGVFHFQPDFPVSDKLAQFIVAEDSHAWIQQVWTALDRWMTANVTSPVLDAEPSSRTDANSSDSGDASMNELIERLRDLALLSGK